MTPTNVLAAPPPPDPPSERALTVRQPPGDVELEMALLGAILVNDQTLEAVSEFLEPAHFHEPAHQRLFDAIQRVKERGQLANPTTLRAFANQDPAISELGGVTYLLELAASAINIIDAESYGRMIVDLYLRRQLIRVGEETVNEAYDADVDQSAGAQIESAEQKLFELATTGDFGTGFRSFAKTLASAMDMAAAAFSREGRLTGIPTGFTHMDRLLGGLQRSDLVILAGRPGMGKTALATNIAFNSAKALVEERDENGNPISSGGHVVAFFSLEMSAEQLALRILGEQSGVPSDAVRRGAITHEQFDKVMQASQELSRLSLFIDDTPAISSAALRTRARRLLRTQGRLDMIVVDYLQLMRASAGTRPENRVQEISEITRGLKAIAKELNVPVIALSQLSRAVEQREDKRPQLADLRESGSIEQDADVVMFVFREEYYLARKEPAEGTEEHDRWQQDMDKVHNLAEVIIAKQRHGPTDKVRLYFQGELTKFGNYDPDGEDGGEPPPF